MKKRVLDQLTKWGNQKGFTLDEYEQAVLDAKEWRDCPACEGTGEVQGQKPRTVGVIHPSSAYSCRLRLYYDVTGEIAPQDEIKPALQFTFAIGHTIHDLVQKALAESVREGNIFYDRTERFIPEARADMGLVSGSTDGDISFELADAILEIKTDGPSSFSKRSSPNTEHRLQAGGLYATALDKPFIVYLYIEKVWPHSIKEYVEVYDPKIFRKWWRNKGRHVKQALSEGVPPKADAKSSECRRCPYAFACPQVIGDKGARAFHRKK